MTRRENTRSAPVDPVALCRELVRIPSFTGEERTAADWAAAEMLDLGFSDVQCDPYGSVTGIWQGEKPGPTLLFDAHLDVAPVTEPERWQHAPFEGEIAGDRLWGRGAADTKASLAAMLAGVSSLERANLAGRVVLAASVQEEILTGAAVTHILEWVKPDVFVTGEPTSLKLATAQKGRVTLELRAHGRSAHTSQPETGENAVDKMIDAILRLRCLQKRIDPDLGQEILVLTEMISEPFPNGSMVPHGCQARMIGRIMPEETQAGFLGRVREILNGVASIDVSIAWLSGSCYTGTMLQMEDFLPGWRNPPDDLWGTKILAALAQEGLPAQSFATGCGTNASAAGSLGITAFIYGPGSLNQAHAVDEWVSAEEIQRAARGFSAIAKGCLNG